MKIKLSKKLKDILIGASVIFFFLVVSAVIGYIVEPQPSLSDGYSWETIGMLNQFIMYIISGIGYVITIMIGAFSISFLANNISIEK